MEGVRANHTLFATVPSPSKSSYVISFSTFQAFLVITLSSDPSLGPAFI